MPLKNLEARRAYNRKYLQEWYKKNRSLQVARVAASKRKNRLWFRAWKKTLKCARCPESFYACLDFHHKRSGTKDGLVSRMVDGGYSKKAILREVIKCQVLCANCHRKAHHR